MTESAPNGEKQRRERPAHWAHPVDEDRRQARAASHRRRRIVLAALLVAAAGLAGGYFYVTSDARVEAFSEAYLEDLLGTDVRIGRASFTWGEGLVLEDLRIIPPPPFREPLLAAKRVDLRVTTLSLLLLAPRVTEIVVHRPQMNLILWDEERWNFQALARTRPLAAGLKARPVVALEEGSLRIERRIAGETVYAHQMVVSGLLLPSETDPDTFRFQTDVKSQAVHLAVSSGLIDARTGALRFEGRASNVALTEELYRSLPREAQRIWDRFELTGPGNSVNVKVLFDEKEGFRLGADLTGVSFSHQYKGVTYRFENLTGICAFSARRLALTGVQGLVNGTQVRIDGEVGGFDQERLAMDLAVEADHVDFQRERESLVGLAPETEAVYQTYHPRGQFDAAMRVRREAPDAPLQVTGVASCRDVEMTYQAFPYRLDHLRGTVRFGPERFETEDLVGRHGQAVVRLEGWTKNPGPLAETEVRISAQNLALDEDLRAALAPAHRRMYDLYSPGGTADAEIAVYRPPQKGAPPEVAVHMTLRDGRFKPQGFPYLVTEATGEVNIWPDRAELLEVRGRHGQARIVLSGEVRWPAADQEFPEVNLKVAGQDVPLDDDLLEALPERDRQVLRTFHLTGLADIEGTVTAGPDTQGRLEYDLDIRLRGARMVYEPFPFQAEQLTGRLRLAKGICRIDSLVGYNSGARIEARGWIEQRPDDYAMDLVLQGADVELGEPLRGALGPEMRAVWSRLAPRGRVDVLAHLRKALGPDEVVRHHVLVTARDAQARLDVFPYPLEHVSGQLEFEGGEVRLHDLKARTGMAEFGLDGRIAYGPQGPDLDLAIRTKGLRLEGGPLRDALPGPFRKAFDAIRPTGRVDVNVTRLSYRSAGPQGAEASWSGGAILDEVGATPGVRVAGLVGTAQLDGRWQAENGRVALQGSLRIQQGKIADKDISLARLLVEKAADSSTVALKGIEGEFYGGRVEGFATIRLEPSTRYTMYATAVDVDFERLLREGFRLEHNLSGGRMRATLGMWAKGAEAQEVAASGYADVADARLYELPPLVRVLNVLRLAPADRTAFQKGRVLYFLRGGRLYLGDIRLEGPAVSLYGAGVLEPDGRIEMTFLTGKHNDDPLIPALSELGEGIRHELALVLVSGTLAEPQVQMRTLSSLTAPFRELVNLVREQRQREKDKENIKY